MKIKNVLSGILISASLGALLGILIAPQKGSKIRKKLFGRKEGNADLLKEKFEDLIDTISQKYEQTLKEAEEIISNEKVKTEMT